MATHAMGAKPSQDPEKRLTPRDSACDHALTFAVSATANPNRERTCR